MSQLVLSWGKCTIYTKKSGQTYWSKEPIPVEDSTQLTPTAQDAREAPVEGGELEARQAKSNKYELVYQLRAAASRSENITHVDGVVADEYAVAVVPEDATAKGIIIDRAAVNVLDNQFNSNAGIVDEYHFVGLKPTTGNIVKRGVIEVTEDSQHSGQYTVEFDD